VGGPLGSAHQSQAPYQAFRTADGWATLGAITPRTWGGLCGALGLEDLLHAERYADSSARHARREELGALIEQRTVALSTAERLHRTGVSASSPRELDHLLAPVVVDLASHLRRVVAPSGALVVSGVLAGAHDHVVEALSPMHIVETVTKDGWAALRARH